MNDRIAGIQRVGDFVPNYSLFFKKCWISKPSYVHRFMYVTSSLYFFVEINLNYTWNEPYRAVKLCAAVLLYSFVYKIDRTDNSHNTLSPLQFLRQHDLFQKSDHIIVLLQVSIRSIHT